jgi:hypothetical protein
MSAIAKIRYSTAILLGALCLCLILFAASVFAQEDRDRSNHRIALVVGISDYSEAPKLANPANDARAMA